MSSKQGPVFIGNLRVPDGIVTAIASGEWILPSEESVILNIFTELPAPAGQLYSIEWMLRETVAWWESPADEYEYYGGGQAAGNSYLTIGPRCSILIGDLGVDMPLALDYHGSGGNPRVLYLPSYAAGWIEVAPDVATFLRRIRRG
jgi:hypothetical protein